MNALRLRAGLEARPHGSPHQSERGEAQAEASCRDERAAPSTRPSPFLSGLYAPPAEALRMEAAPGLEPGVTDLQSVARMT